ncbi:MAG: (2Fe-2S)-binding protein [Desulfomicrobium escambiense]|nr:(2Fe-2S)-binding protein [Desulfomicrobium escambiense]
MLGDKALRAAIDDYYRAQRHGRIRCKREEARVVCNCMNVTDHEIEEAVLEGARTFYELQEKTKVSTVCGECKDDVERFWSSTRTGTSATSRRSPRTRNTHDTHVEGA